MSEMEATRIQQLLDAAYARLKTSQALSASLLGEQDPTQARQILEEIISNCERNLEQVGRFANPHLLSETHIQLATAKIDLAEHEQDPEERERLVRSSTEHSEIAAAVALDSDTTVLPTEILPWSMTVLSKALGYLSGYQNQALQARLAGYARDLLQVYEKHRQMRWEGAQTLFAGQALFDSADLAADESEREAILERALSLAQEARQTLLRAGDREVAEQARRTQQEIEAAQS
jgi:hypothetical protein